MLYLTCTTITSVDLAHCGVSRVKNWVSGDCGTTQKRQFCNHMIKHKSGRNNIEDIACDDQPVA